MAYKVSSTAVCLVCLLLFSWLEKSTATDPDLETIADANNRFALGLYKKLVNSGRSNILFSPLGVSSALSMTSLGADQGTAQQLREALHLDEVDEQEVLHSSFQALLEGLHTTEESGNVLDIASRVFIDDAFLPVYSNQSQHYYSSDQECLNFSSDPEVVRRHINEWIEDKTKRKVRELVAPGLLNTQTQSVLVNAVHFKGSWLSSFRDRPVAGLAPFHKSPDEILQVELMLKQGMFHTGIVSELHAQVLELPYADGRLQMVVLLPITTGGLSAMEDKLNNVILKHLHASTRNTSMDVMLPVFRLEQSLQLHELCHPVGGVTVTPYAQDAGYSFELSLSHVLHKASVEVTKDGREVAPPSVPGRQNERFIASRPFMFYVQDTVSGAMVLMGRVMDPRPLEGGARTNGTSKEEL